MKEVSFSEYSEKPLTEKKGSESISKNIKYLKLKNYVKNSAIIQNFNDEIFNEILAHLDLSDVDLRKKRNMKIILTELTYEYLKRAGNQTSLYEVAESFGVDKEDIKSIRRKIYDHKYETKKYIEKGIVDLELSRKVENDAYNFFEEEYNYFKKHKPKTCAAVCIFLQAEKHGEGRSKRKITNVLNISHQAFINTLKKLKEYKRILY